MDVLFLRSVGDAVPWSFLTLEFLCARKLSCLIQKNFAEAEGVTGAAVKNCSALDCVASGLLRGKRTFASGRRRVREEWRLCAWNFAGEMQRNWSAAVEFFSRGVAWAASKNCSA